MKKTARKSAKTKKAPAKAKAKSKAVKPAAKAKAKAKGKAAAKPKAAKASHGLTVIDLFKMKQERENAAQDPEAWKHRKELPEQDQHHPEDAKGAGGVKKGGFGGARHH